MRLFVSRGRCEAAEFFDYVEAAGIDVVGATLIATEPSIDAAALASLVAEHREAVVVFTSPRAVANAAELIPPPVRESIACVLCAGAATAGAAIRHGFRNSVETAPGQEGVIDHLSDDSLLARSPRPPFLLLRSASAERRLADWLEERGAAVNDLILYRTITVDDAAVKKLVRGLVGNRPDAFAFTSPSSIDAFLELGSIHDPVAYFADSIRLALGQTTANAFAERADGVDGYCDRPGMGELARLAVNTLSVGGVT